MQFPRSDTLEPAQGTVYRELVETIDKCARVLPKSWQKVWKAGKYIRPTELTSLETEAKKAVKAYKEAARLFKLLDDDLAVLQRNVKRMGGILHGWRVPPKFEQTANYNTLEYVRASSSELRNELEKLIAALGVCEEAVKKRPEAERFWRDLGRMELDLANIEKQLRHFRDVQEQVWRMKHE